jgi:hypothetical protein
MSSNRQGGFLIRFDEKQRADLLRRHKRLEDGFSDALSEGDWPVKQWEVCGLMFEPDVITHWALARKGRRVATSKVRIEFTHIEPIHVPLEKIAALVGPQIRNNIVRVASGVGGRVPGGTWQGMKNALCQFDVPAFTTLLRLEKLRDQSHEFIVRPGFEIVAEQRDAVGVALDAFDQTGELRKVTLKSWSAPKEDRLASFLDGLTGVRTIEDQLIAHDVAVFPGANQTRHTVVGAVFAIAGQNLEVFNVNRTEIEKSLGVDLLYFNETFDAWTLVQYKAMERDHRRAEREAFYRPDESFDKELARMQSFRAELPDKWEPESNLEQYRLCGDGFYFKFCPRVQLEVLSDALLPGMYLPRLLVQAALAGSKTKGPRGGRIIAYENPGRHLTNTLFTDLVREGWVGTRGISSAHIADIVREALTSGRSLVIARSRPPQELANLNQTMKTLRLAERTKDL